MSVWIITLSLFICFFITLQIYLLKLSTLVNFNQFSFHDIPRWVRRPRQANIYKTAHPDVDFIEKRSQKHKKKLHDSPEEYSRDHYVYNLTLRSAGRLGNQMFAYASMLGIAHKLKMKPYLPGDSYLQHFFDISVNILPGNANLSKWCHFREKAACAYDEHIDALEPSCDIQLQGFFQSWKYFARIQGRIRKEFTFARYIRVAAIEFLKQSLTDKYVNKTRNDIILVGVHVRRSDMLDTENEIQGYTVASRKYIRVAMTYFEAKYAKVLFVVCTDDLDWSVENVIALHQPVVFSTVNHALLDLAILSMCDHVIMTVGSFGWWGAWLAGGTTLYYKNFPRKNSLLEETFKADDYFSADWIGIAV